MLPHLAPGRRLGSRGVRTMLKLFMVGMGLVLGLAACSDEPAANALEEGQCIDEDPAAATDDIETIDCDESHQYEVVGVRSTPSSTSPTPVSSSPNVIGARDPCVDA